MVLAVLIGLGFLGVAAFVLLWEMQGSIADAAGLERMEQLDQRKGAQRHDIDT